MERLRLFSGPNDDLGGKVGGSDGTRTRGLLRDRQAFYPADPKGILAGGLDSKSGPQLTHQMAQKPRKTAVFD
jgi:hypothetical protein